MSDIPQDTQSPTHRKLSLAVPNELLERLEEIADLNPGIAPQDIAASLLATAIGGLHGTEDANEITIQAYRAKH